MLEEISSKERNFFKRKATFKSEVNIYVGRHFFHLKKFLQEEGYDKLYVRKNSIDPRNFVKE